MKITHNKVGQNLNLTDSAKADKAGKAGETKDVKGGRAKSLLDSKEGEPGASKVDVSTRAHDMKRIKKLADSAPEVDEAKVAKFQSLIDQGKYKVDSEAVADKMVDDHMLFS